MDNPRGEQRTVTVGSARIRYRERGTGRPLVFVHGLFVDGELWAPVVPALAAAGYRCITPDWPFGAHREAVPGTDLTPPGVADLVAGFLEALDLDDAVLIANDTGGGMTQVTMARHPERIGAVVLTPSDSFERFPPPTLAPLPYLARVPGAVRLMLLLLRSRVIQNLPMTFGWVVRGRLPDELVRHWLAPATTDVGVRRDLARFVAGMHRRHTLAAAEALRGFDRPVLLAWARQDKLFPLRLAHRLRDTLPDATLVEIDDSYTFVPLEQPDALARAVLAFLAGDRVA